MIYLIAAIVLILIYMRIETTFLAKSFVSFSSSTEGIKIVHLSDIHINKLFVSVKKLRTEIDLVRPDIIIMSGDYIETHRDIPKFIKFLEYLTIKYRVFLTFGNHDHKAMHYNTMNKAEFIDKIEAAGAKVLMNANATISKNGSTYCLIGIDDVKKGMPDFNKAFEGVSTTLESGYINIAISHNPDAVLELPKSKVDFFFCGHFHGGQIWMPFNLEFRIMRSEKLCKMKCYRGLHKIKGINIYINRGLGNVIFPLRFFSKPEIAVIQLPASLYREKNT